MELSDLTAYAEERYQIREQHKWKRFPSFSVLVDPTTRKWAALLMRRRDETTGAVDELCDIKCGAENKPNGNAPYLAEPFRMRGDEWIGVRFDATTARDVVLKLFDWALEREQTDRSLIVLEDASENHDAEYQETLIPLESKTVATERGSRDVCGATRRDLARATDKIREMRALYSHGDGSFEAKCHNFYVQGKFMEDYEDDYPPRVEIRQYYPTYHDLPTATLRGFFTWRAAVRRGVYEPICSSLAYLYLYELLNGIGVKSPQESLDKIEEFERRFIAQNYGDETMRRNVARWKFEFAVLRSQDVQEIARYAEKETLTRDRALITLRDSNARADEEVFQALAVLVGKKLTDSFSVTRRETESVRLYAQVWRNASQNFVENGRNFFTACFGSRRSYRWYPLQNAVYCFRNDAPKDASFQLDECRTYRCKDGEWYERAFQNVFFAKSKLDALIRETDRKLRAYFQIGRPLMERKESAWCAPFIDAVLDEEQRRKFEELKPKVTIKFSELDQIRSDALETCDRLLTEEDKDEARATLQRTENDEHESNKSSDDESARNEPASELLTREQIQLLRALLNGESIAATLKAARAMPEVVADAINEALVDEIGDSAIECYDGEITLVEDYRDELARLVGVDE